MKDFSKQAEAYIKTQKYHSLQADDTIFAAYIKGAQDASSHIEELQAALQNVIAWRDKNKYKSYPSDVFAQSQLILNKSKKS